MEISEAIRIGRRKILSCVGFELLEDLWWDGKGQCWVFSFRLIGTYAPTDFVPVETYWHCLVSPNYPYGSIDIYPSSEKGISNTFQHQQYNSWDGSAKWRKGNICVSTSLGKWGRKFFNSEPYSAILRLEWHIRRCQGWVEAAANSTLCVNGDPFELPAFPKGEDYLFIFNESEKTFQNWSQIDESTGIVHFKEAFENAHIYPILKFSTKSQEVVYDWGNFITESKGGEDVAVWVKFNAIPIKEPWEMPSHWHELFDIAEKQHINIQETIYRYLFRSKKTCAKITFYWFSLARAVWRE